MAAKDEKKEGRRWKLFGRRKGGSAPSSSEPASVPSESAADSFSQDYSEETAEDIFAQAGQGPAAPQTPSFYDTASITSLNTAAVGVEKTETSDETPSGTPSESASENQNAPGAAKAASAAPARSKYVPESRRRKEKEAEEGVSADDEADTRSLSEVMGRARMIWLGVIVAILVVVLVLIFFSDRIYNYFQGTASYELQKNDTQVSFTTGSVSIDMFGDQLLRCSQDGIQAIRTDGSIVWDVPYTMSAPSMVHAGQYVCVADQLGTEIITLQNGIETCDVTTENTIIMNTVNEVGQAAVVIAETDGNSVVLYSSAGSLLMKRRTYSKTDGIPMGVALNSDGTRMATIYMDYSGTDIRSIITVFDLTESGSTLVDRILGSYTLDGCVVSDIKFVGDHLFYASTQYLGAINATTNTNEVWQTKLSYEIESLVLCDDFFVVRYGEGLAGAIESAQNNIVIYNYDGEVLAEKAFEDATYLDATNETIIVGQERTYTGLTSGGTVRWTMSAIEDYSRLMGFPNGKTVAALRRGRIDFYDVVLKNAGDEGD